MQSRSVLLKNMFDPEELAFTPIPPSQPHSYLCRETERDWDKDLADDVKGECEDKYGRVDAIKVEKDSQVSIFFHDWHIKLTMKAGRDIPQVQCHRLCKESHPRIEWAVVWRATSLCRIHIRRYYDGSPINSLATLT